MDEKRVGGGWVVLGIFVIVAAVGTAIWWLIPSGSGS